ncbi:DUF4012 domain-containing protein [Microbacterium sp. NPDC090007]|uniref:DUF4012 domain-containing protein n=1 Tax=Microbacterium sp. NPDC090007 TaxID=3364204 RepID=UPI003806B9FB
MARREPVLFGQKAGRITLWVVSGALILGVALATWIGIRGALGYQHLRAIEAGASRASAQILADPAQARSLVASLAEEAKAARDLTGDPIWGLAEQTPWVGPQLEAVRIISASSSGLLGDGLRPLVDAVGETSLDVLKPIDGRIDPAAIARLAAPAKSAAIDARDASSAVAEINTVPLLGIVQGAVERVSEAFARTADGLDALSRATDLLPGMLGEDGPRQYLVLVQNNAEARSLGGIAGTAILLRTEGGAVSLGDTRSGTSLSEALQGTSAASLSPDATALYGERPARYFQNVTQVPDFTVDGPLARQMYQSVTGVSVDGVITIDPVVLSYMLATTGPIQLQDGTVVDGSNAASLFLNDVYKRFPDPKAQDAFFGEATAIIFKDFLGGKGSTPGLLSAFSRGAEERRVLLWSTHEDEQAVLSGSTFAGALPITNERTARFGVYFNDAGGSKMSYYVKPDVRIAWSGCVPGAASERELTLSVSLTSTAPADAATSLPRYLTANGAFGVAPGNAATLTNVFLPEGWDLVSAASSNGLSFADGTYAGRRVLSIGTNLAPQASNQLDIVVQKVSTAAEAEAFVTPTADGSIDPTPSADCGHTAAPLLQ